MQTAVSSVSQEMGMQENISGGLGFCFPSI